MWTCILSIILCGIVGFLCGIWFEKLNPETKELKERYLALRDELNDVREEMEIEVYKEQLHGEVAVNELREQNKAVLVFADGLKRAVRK